MPQKLINRSSDLKKLRDEGYEIEVKGGYLIIHHIPYVNSKREIEYGKLITNLSLNGDRTIKPNTHVMHFMGEYPCNKDGTIISAIKHTQPNKQLFEGIVMNYSFSNKPKGGYSDYHEKVTVYAEIISSQAKSIDPRVTVKTFKVIQETDENNVFNYIDTNASRANIDMINSKFEGQKIGIVGLGGTGSYILDFVAKTPVEEIHLFDRDVFLQHNAFRSPGAPSVINLEKKMNKAEYFASIYSEMHRGIKAFATYITEENIDLLAGLSFVFICIDSNYGKSFIISKLLKFGIPFIDCGIGVNVAENNLVGSVRSTVVTSIKKDHIETRIGTDSNEENEYSTNIQIADLNALNAILAVIKWKKKCGFYQDQKKEHHITYVVNTNQLLNDE